MHIIQLLKESDPKGVSGGPYFLFSLSPPIKGPQHPFILAYSLVNSNWKETRIRRGEGEERGEGEIFLRTRGVRLRYSSSQRRRNREIDRGGLRTGAFGDCEGT